MTVEAATPRDKELFAWVEAVRAGAIVRASLASGGNRARSWAIDLRRPDGAIEDLFLRYSLPRPPSGEPYTIWREAQVYRAIAPAKLKAPRLVAEHPSLPALLTDRAAGIAEFRRLTDPAAKASIAAEFMENLARLHALPVSGLKLDAGVDSPRIIDHVRAEIGIWRAMYEETAVRDPLIEFAFRWLERMSPDPDEPPVLAHGDAGPGNFLFAGDRLTALIDWELAHLGDPMEDLAWFSMRCVMEPVPDFNATLAAYAVASGRTLDRFRILYHRVLVSARVTVIRHRNVTGEAGNAIVSRALNRRLLVQALGDAAGLDPAPPPIPTSPPSDREALYDGLLADLRAVATAPGSDRPAIVAAKSAPKVAKYLKAHDRHGAALEAAELAALAEMLGEPPTGLAAGRLALAGALSRDEVSFERALAFFALQSAGEALLAAESSGGIAARAYPALEIASAR